MAKKLKRSDFRDAVAEIDSLSAERQAKIREGARTIIEAAHLAEIRRRLNVTQTGLSVASGIKQGEISRIERNPERAQLQTIERYARGLGGTTRLVVDFPDGTQASVAVAGGKLVKSRVATARTSAASAKRAER
jgi:transcriptional regulator with XRE-family HTH domain